MISKKYRLREYEVTRVFKKGRPSFGAFWTVNALEVRNAKNHRMAVTITRKHDKRAVMRNRYRRGLYDGMRDLLVGQIGGLKLEVGSEMTASLKSTTNLKLPTGNYYCCVFTLKKGLKLTETKIPEVWLDDARKTFSKIVKPLSNTPNSR